MLASHKGEIPFVVYILPFLTGIALALSFNFGDYALAVAISFGLLLTIFILLNILYDKTNLYRNPWIGGTMMHILMLLAGLLITINYDSRSHPDYFAKHPADLLTVRISNEPQLKGNFLRFTADVKQTTYKGSSKPASGTMLLTIVTDSAYASKINYGDEILIPAKYNPIDPPFNPGEFNYKQYLAHQNIYSQAFLTTRDVMVIKDDTGNPIIAWSLKLRQGLVGQFKRHMRSKEAIAVASTLILGYKAELDNDILQAYSKTGTIHVLSVSGAHVAIIFAMIGWLLGFMDKYRYGKLLKVLISLILIWYYSILTGLSPAVCRAAVMINLIIIGNNFARYISTLNILAASAFGLLLIDPFLIVDVGFQLSYLAIIGLVVFQPIVYGWLDIENKWLDWFWKFCSACLAIQVLTFPLSAYYFHQFPVYFLVSNLFIIVPVEVIMYAGIGCLGLAQLGWSALANVAGWILEKSILLMDWFLQLIERSPYASAGKIWLNGWELLLLSGLIVLSFAIAYYKKPVLIKIAAVCLLLLSISVSVKSIRATKFNNITFLNLKKHSGILFKQGNCAVLLTDLLDTDKTYRYSIQPGLDSNRINNLSIVHFNKDTATTFWAKQGNLVRFVDKDVLIYDKDFWYDSSALKIPVDYVFVTGSPHVSPGVIDKGFQYRTLVTDAGNTDKTVNALKAGLSNYDRKMYVLKRNKSLIIESE